MTAEFLFGVVLILISFELGFTLACLISNDIFFYHVFTPNTGFQARSWEIIQK